MTNKIDKFLDKLDWTLDLAQETQIGKRIKENGIEKLLGAAALVLTLGVALGKFTGKDIRTAESCMIYTGAVASLISLIGYRIKRCYDYFKDEGMIY
jgi:hypothetical protein